jgi:DNA-binding MarR family transcriptional regulator
MSDVPTDPRTRELYDLAVRIGLSWREIRRGAAGSAVRDWLYGGVVAAVEHGQMDTLEMLAQRPSWRMSELADALRIDPSTLTRGVQRLEGKGLAQRTSCAADRRVVEVTLTPEGERVHQVLVERRTELMTHILRAYRTSELRDFAELLERFVASVDTFVAQHRDEH